jgi:hypothetical protein
MINPTFKKTVSLEPHYIYNNNQDYFVYTDETKTQYLASFKLMDYKRNPSKVSAEKIIKKLEHSLFSIEKQYTYPEIKKDLNQYIPIEITIKDPNALIKKRDDQYYDHNVSADINLHFYEPDNPEVKGTATIKFKNAKPKRDDIEKELNDI